MQVPCSLSMSRNDWSLVRLSMQLTNSTLHDAESAVTMQTLSSSMRVSNWTYLFTSTATQINLTSTVYKGLLSWLRSQHHPKPNCRFTSSPPTATRNVNPRRNSCGYRPCQYWQECQRGQLDDVGDRHLFPLYMILTLLSRS